VPATNLVDGDALADLLKQLSLGVRTRMVEEIEVGPSFCTTIWSTAHAPFLSAST
jgi:hypothetical protein